MNWLAVLLGSVSHANWPDEETVIRLFTLQDYNTRVVLLGVTALGLASGIIGSFMILRKRALLSDSIAHATLPGICITFLILSAMDINSKNFFFLLFGAGLSGIISILCVQFLRAYTKLKEDAVLGIILSSFFGFGVVLMGFVQQHPKGNAAGIDGYIFGKTASIQAHDAQMLMINES